jgi:enoyl-CoA hydratase/carnithine racemase
MQELCSDGQSHHLLQEQARGRPGQAGACGRLIEPDAQSPGQTEFLRRRDASSPRKDTTPPDLGDTIETFYNPLIRLMRGLDKPIICAVNEVAAGAGANIALARDIMLAARSAKFIPAFSRVSLIPDSGGTWSLSQLVGEARGKALALTAEPLAAEPAAAWGLIWRVVEDADLTTEAEALGKKLAAGPPFALGLINKPSRLRPATRSTSSLTSNPTCKARPAAVRTQLKASQPSSTR